ncbi:MAG TPA: hypothetical protein VIY56_07915 [Vicinamibacterales bacterium]
MTRAISQVVVAAAIVGVAAVGSLAAQSSATSVETKAFEVIGVDGSTLVVRLPEGTREIAVPADFRFTVNGQQLSVRELRPGMKGTATITTRTTVTPVTVTEVRNGTVAATAGSSIIVRTDTGVQSFSQGEVDKRGVKVFRDGVPVQLTQLRTGDRLSAVIVTSQPPRVVTEKEVQATTAAAAAATAAPTATRAAAAPGSSAPAAAPAARTSPAPAAAAAPAAAPAPAPRTALPQTASSWPLLGLASALALAAGLVLTIRRRLVH